MISHWIKARDGREYPVRFTNGVILQLAVSEGVPSNQVQKFLKDFASWPLGRVYKLYYLMMRYGAKKEGVEFDMDEEDFLYLIGEDETLIPQIVKVMTESSPQSEKKTTQRQGSK